jgi:hypothetical protein
MSDNPFIQRCLNQALKKFSAGEPESWTDREYKQLSDDIYSSCGTLISVLTLKRLFGRIKTSGGYNPQEATKDALARYLGFDSWDNYIDKGTAIRTTSKKIKPFFLVKTGLYFLIAVACIIFGLKMINSLIEGEEEYSFIGDNLKGVAPHTAIFYYDIAGIRSDSVFIDFDDTQQMVLPKNRSFIKHGYLIPYYFRVKLLKNKEILDTVKVHVASPQWEARIGYERFEPTVVLVEPDSVDYFYVSPEQVEKKGYDKSKGFYYLDYRFFEEFGVSGDDMIFECKFMNSKQTGGLYCKDVLFDLVCDYNNVILQFYQPGCEVAPQLKISETAISGEFNDLSSFTLDLSEWVRLRLVLKKQTAMIYIADRLLFETTYQSQLGLLKGININTMGSGCIDDVMVFNAGGELFYSEDFE